MEYDILACDATSPERHALLTAGSCGAPPVPVRLELFTRVATRIGISEKASGNSLNLRTDFSTTGHGQFHVPI